jgi:hypothetical protein
MRELTGIEVDKKGTELYEAVRKYLEDNDLDNTLHITPNHIEWGTYDTKLYFDTPTHTLDLFGL